MKIYLDNCALGRLLDEEIQPRIQAEAEAVRNILRLVVLGQVQWFSSSAFEAEIAQNTHAIRRRSMEVLLAGATRILQSDASIVSRSVTLQTAGLTYFDALHIAFAEAAEVDAFLTTDDRLIRKAQRLLQSTSDIGIRPIIVANPLDWVRGNIR